MLAMTVNGKTDTYLFRSTPNEDGIVYDLAHDSGDVERVYSVLISPRGNSCMCKGYAFRGHCRHIDCFSVLVQRTAQAASVPVTPAPRKSFVCYSCRDTKMTRRKTPGGVCVGRCATCENF